MRPRAGRGTARVVTALAVACVLFAAAPAAAQAPRPKPAIVTVNDFYFGPDTVTIKAGRVVKWVWSETNTYPHDVHLKQGPKQLKNRASYSTRTTAVTGAVFKKTFERAGTYHYICTIHPTLMKLTITVRK